MMRESEGLKVYCYAKPHCKHFREEEFGTVGQFQHAVQEWFGIAVSDQKLVMDGRVMEEKWLTSPFKELNIKEKSHLIVLTKKPHLIKKKIRIVKQLTDDTIEKSLTIVGARKQQEKTIQKLSQEYEAKSVKLLSCLKDTATDALITQVIKALRIPRSELLLLNQPKLLFILDKITQNTPNLREIFLNRIDTVKLALIDQTKLQQSNPIPSTTSSQTVDYLISLGYQRQAAVKALQICRNDLFTALNMLNGHMPEQSIQFEAKKETLTQEFIRISSWLGNETNRPLLQYLKHKPADLSVFISTWRHVCPELYRFAVKWYSYLPQIIQHHIRTIYP